MALDIGQTIRNLRKERNLTQEALAEQLNVSAQAVSKWENGTGYPDISQIVPLAAIFGVSTDVLLGAFSTNNDEEALKLIEEIEAPMRSGRFQDDAELLEARRKEYEKLLDALKRHPNSKDLLITCLGCGVNLYTEMEERSGTGALFVECEREAGLLINYCKDMFYVTNAHMWLVRLYSQSGDYKKAKEHAATFPAGPDMTSGAMLAWVRRASGDTNGEIDQRCRNIGALLLALQYEIIPLGNAYRKKEQYEDAKRVYESVFGLIRAVYGDEAFTPPLNVLGRLHGNLADCCLKSGDEDGAFRWLNRYADFCLLQKKCCSERKRVVTPLLRAITFDFSDYPYPAKELIENELSRSVFDPIRGDARFSALLGRANALED